MKQLAAKAKSQSILPEQLAELGNTAAASQSNTSVSSPGTGSAAQTSRGIADVLVPVRAMLETIIGSQDGTPDLQTCQDYLRESKQRCDGLQKGVHELEHRENLLHKMLQHVHDMSESDQGVFLTQERERYESLISTIQQDLGSRKSALARAREGVGTCERELAAALEVEATSKQFLRDLWAMADVGRCIANERGWDP